MPKSSRQQLAYFLHKLSRLRNYVRFSEKSWEEYLAAYNRSLDDDALNVAEFGGRRDHWADLATVFPQYHRRASFLMLFAMFEDDLNELCRSVAAERKLTRPLEKTRGRGIERAKAWLAKVAQLDLGPIDKEWKKITQFRDLRNVLIHAAGFLEQGNPQHESVRTFTHVKSSGLQSRRYARTEVILTSEFLPMVLDTFEAFYKSLVQITQQV